MKYFLLFFSFCTPLYSLENYDSVVFKKDSQYLYIINAIQSDKMEMVECTFLYQSNYFLKNDIYKYNNVYSYFPRRSQYYRHAYDAKISKRLEAQNNESDNDKGFSERVFSVFSKDKTWAVSCSHRGIGFFINKDELCGYSRPLFFSDCWRYIAPDSFKDKNKIMFSSVPAKDIYHVDTSLEKALTIAQKNGAFITIDEPQYRALYLTEKEFKNQNLGFRDTQKYNKITDDIFPKIELLLKQSSQPMNTIVYYDANIPILLVDEKHHKMRADSDDWRIYTYLNPHNGEFYQYFFFEKELELEWPLYIRDFAMDHLAGAHTCKYSTVAVKNKTHEKVVKKKRGRYDSRDIQITEINNKPWRPDPVPEDKNTIPKNRLFFDVEVGRIFGSRAKVWELKVWSKLPEMLRDNPDGVYLVGYGSLLHLLDTKTPHDEQLLLQKTGVLITPTLYKQLNVLRKFQTKNTK